MLRHFRTTGALSVVCCLALTLPGCKSTHKTSKLDDRAAREREAAAAIERFKQTDPGMEKFFDGARGYAVFPSVGKAAWIVGGAHGKGVVYEEGEVVGYTTLTQASVGAQWGGQAFSQIIFFVDETAVNHFKRGNFQLGAQAAAVAVTVGASADADYHKGVAVFTVPRGGLMLDVSVGGQKFTFPPK